MSEFIDEFDDVPDTSHYVVMRDRFLSGWGQSEGKDYYLIAPCDSAEEAEIVQNNAYGRGDQDDIMHFDVRDNLEDFFTLHDHYLWGLMDKEESANWYKEGMWQ